MVQHTTTGAPSARRHDQHNSGSTHTNFSPLRNRRRGDMSRPTHVKKKKKQPQDTRRALIRMGTQPALGAAFTASSTFVPRQWHLSARARLLGPRRRNGTDVSILVSIAGACRRLQSHRTLLHARARARYTPRLCLCLNRKSPQDDGPVGGVRRESEAYSSCANPEIDPPPPLGHYSMGLAAPRCRSCCTM